MPKRTVPAAADLAAAGQTTTLQQTAACEVNRHHLCRGTLVSLTAAHGAACQCPCHGGDDRAIEAALEQAHFGELPFDA
jgi:hypothetical protein